MKELGPKTVIPVVLTPIFLRIIFALLAHQHFHFLRKWKYLRLQRLEGWYRRALCRLQ